VKYAFSYFLSFVLLLLFAAGTGKAETFSPTLQIIRGDEYSDWTLVDSCFLYKDQRAAMLVCTKDGQTAVMIAERAVENFIVVAYNDTIFRNAALEDKNRLWIGDDTQLSGRPFIWYTGENLADTFYLMMEKNEAEDWQITSGFFGDESIDDYIAFYLTNGGTALGINDVVMWQPQVYVPLEWDMTLQEFDPQIIIAACKEAITH